MSEHFIKIEKFQCKYCDEEFTSECDVNDHIEYAKHYNNGLVCEIIPNHLKVIRVKRVHDKEYTIAKVEGFGYDTYHHVKIYLDRWCYNRDSDHFPENETSCQCSIREILSKDQLHEYSLSQSGLFYTTQLTEDMVTEL